MNEIAELARRLAGLPELLDRTKTMPDEPRFKRKRAKKIKAELGPFETACTTYDRGERLIEIVRLNPAGITYRMRGLADEYFLPHAVGFQKALSIKAQFDTGPRSGAIKRGV